MSLPPSSTGRRDGAADLLSILQLTAVDRQTGAGRVAASLAEGLAARGHRVRAVVGHRKSDDPGVREIWERPLNNLVSALAGRNVRRALHRRLAPWLANDIAWLPGRRLPRWPQVRDADLVHAHTLHSGFFNLKALPALGRERPLVWTLHDMWALTGYPVHAWDCPHWPTGGCDCELPSTLPPLRWNNTRHLWRLKRRIYRRADLQLVAPSRWLAERVARSMLADKPLRVIPNGVDVARYQPGDRLRERQRWGLPAEPLIVLFVGRQGSRDVWKGWSHARRLIDALASDRGLLFVAVGAAGPDGANLRQLPFSRDAEAMASLYAASDLLLYPTLADNCPLVVLEAQAAGLPVLAFATGGVPELVADGESGWLVPTGDDAALGARFAAWRELRPEERAALGAAARRRAVECFSAERMVDAYLDLYRELVAARRERAAGGAPSSRSSSARRPTFASRS